MTNYKKFFIVIILAITFSAPILAEPEEKANEIRFFDQIETWVKFKAQNTADEIKLYQNELWRNLSSVILRNFPSYRDFLPYEADIGLRITMIRNNNWGFKIEFDNES